MGGPGGFGPAWMSGGAQSGGCGPWSSWSGAWGPSSQWTGVWSGCRSVRYFRYCGKRTNRVSTATASPLPATVTTTVNGQVVTGTTFGESYFIFDYVIHAYHLSIGVQAVSATATSASGNAAPAITQMAAGGAVMAALVGVVAAL